MPPKLSTKAFQKRLSKLGASRAPALRQALRNAVVRSRKRRERVDFVPRQRRDNYRFHASSLFRSYPILHTNLPGYTIAVEAIAPSSLDQRVALFNCAFEKYRIHQLRFTVQLIGPALEDFAILQAFDSDIGDKTPSDDQAGLTIMSTWRHHLMSAHLDSSSKVMDVVVRQPDDGYYTNYDAAGDLRLSFCGQYYIKVITPPAADACNINVSVDYDVEFFEPQLDNAAPATNVSDATEPPTTTNNGWGNLGSTDYTKLTDVKNVFPIANSLGYKGLRFFQGTYHLLQSFISGTASTAVGFGYLAPTLANTVPYAPSATLTNKVYMTGPPGATSAAAAVRYDEIYVPFGQVLDLYSSYTTKSFGSFAGTLTNLVSLFRLFN